MDKQTIPNVKDAKNLLRTVRYSSHVLESLVYEYERSFCSRFTYWKYDDIIAITQLAFSSENVRLVYVNEDGMHVSDSICMDEFESWIDSICKEVI